MVSLCGTEVNLTTFGETAHERCDPRLRLLSHLLNLGKIMLQKDEIQREDPPEKVVTKSFPMDKRDAINKQRDRQLEEPSAFIGCRFANRNTHRQGYNHVGINARGKLQINTPITQILMN